MKLFIIFILIRIPLSHPLSIVSHELSLLTEWLQCFIFYRWYSFWVWIFFSQSFLVFCLFACLFSLFVGFFNLVFNTFCYTHLGNCSCCYQYASYFNGYIHHQFTQSMNYIQFSYFFPIKTLPFGFYDFLCQFPINLLNLLCYFILSWLASWYYYFSRPKAGPTTLLFLHLLPRLSYPFTWL